MIKSLIINVLILLTICKSETISGYIKNSKTGKPIPNANIFIRGTDLGTVSNINGYYKINLSNGAHIVETSIIGFKTDIREIIIKKKKY